MAFIEWLFYIPSIFMVIFIVAVVFLLKLQKMWSSVLLPHTLSLSYRYGRVDGLLERKLLGMISVQKLVIKDIRSIKLVNKNGQIKPSVYVLTGTKDIEVNGFANLHHISQVARLNKQIKNLTQTQKSLYISNFRRGRLVFLLIVAVMIGTIAKFAFDATLHDNPINTSVLGNADDDRENDRGNGTASMNGSQVGIIESLVSWLNNVNVSFESNGLEGVSEYLINKQLGNLQKETQITQIINPIAANTTYEPNEPTIIEGDNLPAPQEILGSISPMDFCYFHTLTYLPEKHSLEMQGEMIITPTRA